MNIYYGSAIQGELERGSRKHIHETVISLAQDLGHNIIGEPLTSKNREEIIAILEKMMGPLPKEKKERYIHIRNNLIDIVEGDIQAAIFEFSISSTGAGIEFAHAYSRPRFGLTEIPILVLYEKNYWPNGLSTMVNGLDPTEFPNVQVKEYSNSDELKKYVLDFLTHL